MESIHLQSLKKHYGSVLALDGVSLEISAGELFFLLGASGCGKSTLLRCIAGLEAPDSGEVRFGSRDVTALPPHRREAAMVFQSYALWPHLTVSQNIAFGLEERRIAKAEIQRRVAEALESVQMPHLAHRAIDELSGGQQQRVALARALVVRPKCLLLDEPLSNLDAKLRLSMRQEIRRIVKEHGLTAIYVTHDQEEALSMADRMAVMDHGQVMQVGTPLEVYAQPNSPHVASFIGETNLISGTLKELSNGTATVLTAAGILTGRLADSSWQPGVGEQVVLSIRPEAWQFDGTHATSIAGRIVERSYGGPEVRYWIETAAGRLQMLELNPRQLRTPGSEDVALHVHAHDVVVLPPDQTVRSEA